MILVGLTGGIGSGKTTVAKIFKKKGVPVYNSDKAAKRLMKRSKKVRKAIITLLGEKAYIEDKLNKPFIASKIFNDNATLEKFNAIVHPAVKKHFLKWVKKQKTTYVIQESAIIFENNNQKNYDRIILVTAPIEERVKRVLERDNVDKAKVMERVKNQLDDSIKISQSSFVIENIDLKTTQKQVDQIHFQLLHKPDKA